MFALDTNTLVYFFRGSGDVPRRLAETPPREIAIPAVVLYELEVGIAGSSNPKPRRKALETLVPLVRILPFDEAAARAAATIRVQLEAAGMPIGPMDTLIAGTAVANHAVLVTRNTREFSSVPGLRIVDWY